MKHVYLLLSFLLSTVALAQDLDFQTTGGGWATGALSKSYTNIGTPATNVSVSISPAANFQANNPNDNTAGLGLNMNWTTNSQCVTTTITFSPGVSNLSFNLQDVDRGQGGGPGNNTPPYNYVDQVTVTGTNGGTANNPTIGPSSQAGVNVVSGNTVTALTPGNSNQNLVQFSGVVTQITVQYCNGPNTDVNPGTQGITIGDLSWIAPLPVHLISFQGKVVGNQIALAWETAWEENNDYFEVQRSRDAQEFLSIARINGVGQSDSRQNYSVLDEWPLTGTNYYRLKQVDADGERTVTYSKIVAVILNNVTPALEVIGNPSERTQIRFAFRNIDPQSVKLQTSSGVVVPCQFISESETKAVLIPAQPLATGLYLLNSQDGLRRLAVKVIVL